MTEPPRAQIAILDAHDVAVGALSAAEGDPSLGEVVLAGQRVAYLAGVDLRDAVALLAEAEAEMEKWDKFISHHPEHVEALKAEAEAWWDANRAACRAAERSTKSFVPPDVLSAGTSFHITGSLAPKRWA